MLPIDRHRSLSLLLLLVGALLLMAGSAAAAFVSETSPWEYDFQGARGLTVRFAGVPIIRQSTLYVVKPGWSGLLYDQRSQRHGMDRQDRQLRISAANTDFRSTYTVRELSPQQLQIRFTGELVRDVPAEIELALGYFNANLIAGREWSALTPAGLRSGTVDPVEPASADQVKNDLAPGFSTLQFRSRIGTLKVEVESAERVMFFDARRDPQEWARTAPIFWCGLGVPARKLSLARPANVVLTLTVEPQAVAGDREVQVAPRWEQVRPALPLPSLPVPVPSVSERTSTGAAGYLLNSADSMVFLGDPDDRLVRLAQRHLKLSGPITWKKRKTGYELRIGSPGAIRGELPSTSRSRLWDPRAEAYRIVVDRRGCRALGPTPMALAHAIRTLGQLVTEGPQGRELPALEVTDSPAQGFRGVHLFTSASGVEFHRRLIRQVLAPLKINTLVLQCEAAAWKSLPGTAAPDSISVADLRSLVTLCRENFIEPIPLLNVPGHAEWFFRNKRNLHICEDPEVAYALCTRHPETTSRLHAVLEEVLEIFQPRWVHLGHDEVTMRGQFPHPRCPRCAGQSVTDLVMDFAQREHAWLRTRGVKMMIWGDMLLGRDEVPNAGHAPDAREAAERRKRLPKDVVIADWHYSGDRFPSLDLFRASGHAVIASTWHDLQNIKRFSAAGRSAGALGLLQTTWAGYFPNEKVLDGPEWRQIAAFVPAAQHSWSGRSLGSEPDFAGIFRQFWSTSSPTSHRGWALDLVDLQTCRPKDWLGLGKGWDAPVDSDRVAVLGHAPFAPSGSSGAWVIPVGKRAAAIAVSATAGWAAPSGTVLARLVVEYAGGERVVVPIVMGRHVGSWLSREPVAEAWRTSHPGPGTVRRSWTFRLELPHPDRAVRLLRLESVGGESVLAISALALLEGN